MPLDGFKMQTAGAMCVTHTMSLEQMSNVDLVVEGHVLHSCRVLLQDGWKIGMLSERRRG